MVLKAEFAGYYLSVVFGISKEGLGGFTSPEVELHVMVRGISYGTMDLLADPGYQTEGFVDPGLSHGHLFYSRQPVTYSPGCLVGHESYSIRLDLGIGQVVLDSLEAADGMLEGNSLAGIGNGHLQGCLGGTQKVST